MAYNSFVLTKKKVLLNSLFYQLTLAVCVCVCVHFELKVGTKCLFGQCENFICSHVMWIFECQFSVHHWKYILLRVIFSICKYRFDIEWASRVICFSWSRHVFFIFPHVCVHHKAKNDDDKKKLRKFQFAWKWLENKQPRKVYIKLGNVYHSY